MFNLLINIMTSAISGCLVAFFAHWLRTRSNKKGDK
ncbi:TPA: type I toxin-antitoxin system Fst family toxin [Staphylococcus aureus]|uniref:Type I toxin-antitoxin system Fst family toxin n=1 Tax=Staphylococcus schweitzeri TaxID=1654388 RepID=A0A2K4AFL5_9STAP|nr:MULTISPECIES: type I toxin-antitoxin system Fst family toxin [Staphylococcus]HDH6407155.1 type I toxin-antitoxin system Fst family toxin [Staphylococcus aureus MRSA-Lux-40]HDJ6917675.1 type I toxin-antitoxin system Fst family toxin [Staphylococcus aureus Sa_TPS3169]HDJ6920279.1 type I toxin-antitoxin system Fst family toxin [Staphylococcus aureus Sa_TPS3162]HDJ6928583.1 type I toxin-antitoxin system Fst family toxin [Staphylococcus aureus Sa_TPS3157]HDJ6931164.1 type I toxin-antitoxin syste